MQNPLYVFGIIIQTYLSFAVIVSTAIGLIGLPRYYQERDKKETKIMKTCETTRSILWDIIIHFMGFLLLAVFIGSIIAIWVGGEPIKELVCLATAILTLFYAIFCLSGRGVQILTAMTTTMSHLDFGWKGITIHFTHQQTTDKNP